MDNALLARLVDERDILRLNARYNWACYERDPDAYADCFVEDGVYESAIAAAATGAGTSCARESSTRRTRRGSWVTSRPTA